MYLKRLLPALINKIIKNYVNSSKQRINKTFTIFKLKCAKRHSNDIHHIRSNTGTFIKLECDRRETEIDRISYLFWII